VCIAYGNTINLQDRHQLPATSYLPSTLPHPTHPSYKKITHSHALAAMDEEDPTVLTAVSSSARQLFLLLRCITFSNKAHVTISEEGLKFSVSEGSSMEGMRLILS
jgi:hypothetical protein